ncbi:MAG: Pr6Pr family membrane protein [Actinobacteria bacterium]|nr:Pr6Pr family membrane protein [Actinomycetota bacterium]
MKENIARIWMGLTALGSFAGLCISLAIAFQPADAANMAHVGGNAPVEAFEHLWVRIMTVFSYFTIQSNIIVIVTCTLLAFNFHRISDTFRGWRLMGLVAITITGIVYNGYLAHLPGVNPQGWSLVSTDLLHVYTPFMAVVGWLAFGPRSPFKMKYAWWLVAYAAAWVTYTLIRGAWIGWYPYPFVDAKEIGYPMVFVMVTIIGAIGFGFAVLGMWADKHLPEVIPNKNDPASIDEKPGKPDATTPS